VLLAGNVEIHIKTGDWLKHGHQRNKSYNRLILHAVYEHDLTLRQNEKHGVEVLELKPLIDAKTLKAYARFFRHKQALACAKQMGFCNDAAFSAQLDKSLKERLSQKCAAVERVYRYKQKDFTQTFYICLLRNFGFKVNAEAFELLAKQLPPGILLKHRDNLLQLECLLLGTAGFLSETFDAKHFRHLQNEYAFLKNKYGLIPLNRDLFKFSRLRPANFPPRRLAQFAAFIHQCGDIFLAPHKAVDYADLNKRLSVDVSAYWRQSARGSGALGQEAIDNLIINSFVPFLLFYAQQNGKSKLESLAMNLLQQCAFEKNKITGLFALKKHLFLNAGHSQALIGLHHNFCRAKKCLQCGVAAGILKPAST
jgi:hypothetical protein